jgi:hypothetical protein
MTASAASHLSEQGRSLFGRLAAVRVGVALAVTGFVVIAVHILDDNFVQPQPGTSTGDHLVSGLVPRRCTWERPPRIRACGRVRGPRSRSRWER